VFRKMLEVGLTRAKSPNLPVDHGDELELASPEVV
jgi:hypothetical protein